MSRQLDLPLQAHLWQVNEAPTVVFTTPIAHSHIRTGLEELGVEVITLPTLTPRRVMDNLYQRGFLTVLWECGGTLAAAAIADKVVQKVWAFIAPKLIGVSMHPPQWGI
jgi:diaminohydroxyphosphoribosylaminopyrimidine deaminase/5-amino-6-(5-phosphoribosylamino)uracil reductase